MSGSVHVISPVDEQDHRVDLDLICSILELNDFNVTRYEVEDRNKITRSGKLAQRVIKGRFDINLFLAPILPEWLPMARRNVVMPNVDSYPEHLVKWLPQADVVMAKTRLTERIFKDLGCKTEFTSFSSRDHLEESVKRDRMKFFHSCSSPHKGTRSLLETWCNHPEWPELVALISRDEVVPEFIDAANITLLRKNLPLDEVKRLQNSCVFHLCCSEAEGYGHHIMEAMSCRGVPLTTNAPPMNELIDASRGLLVEHQEPSLKHGLSRAYYFKPEALEAQVERAMALSDEEIEKLGCAGRAFTQENDLFFRVRFLEVLQSVL